MKIKKTKKMGLGVFATQDYRVGDIIEECHSIIVNSADRAVIDTTDLYNYYFSWGEDLEEAAFALGNGSLYNHSYNPNAEYIKLLDKKLIQFVAHTNIQSGEEITVNYNGDPSSDKSLWFKTLD